MRSGECEDTTKEASCERTVGSFAAALATRAAASCVIDSLPILKKIKINLC